ncbi:MAG TPA: RNA polymerase sigma factor [Candidatus Acidoferrum sp.]|jgi:RNA polymerase sigma-70 factor (ECF subfamily)
MSAAASTLCSNSLHTSSQHTLLAEARRGSHEAFTEMVSPYVPTLYKRARRLTGNPADAEDVQQEALLKAWSRLDQFSGNQDETNNDFRAWVARIGANSSIDLLRQRRDSKMISLEESKGPAEETLGNRIPCRQDNPEERFARRQRNILLARAIAQLQPDLRQTCLLRDVLQYSTQETADRIGISIVAVRLRLFRAHRQLRENLQKSMRPKLRHSPSALNPHRNIPPTSDNRSSSSLAIAPAYASGD